MVAEQVHQLGVSPAAVILEPVGRNTAPAVAVAALAAGEYARARHAVQSPSFLVLPADHVIPDVAAFQNAALIAVEQARLGKLVAFGVVARAPETGYGYIRRGDGAGPVYPIAQFVEKPTESRAQEYIVSGEYYWNSGMFVLQASGYLAELKNLAPDILAACEKALAGASRDLDFTRLPRRGLSRRAAGTPSTTP